VSAPRSRRGVLGVAPILLPLVFVLQAALSHRLDRWVHPRPFEAVKTQSMDPKVSSAMRALAFLGGQKVLVGHIFWIHVAQYYGDTDNARDRYAQIYDFCSLASDLNPRLTGIYTFGAAVLAFHVNRPEEAFRLLAKGIQANPEELGLKNLYAAVLFRHSENYERAVPFLEAQIRMGEAPTMLVNILANTYAKVGRTQDAIRVWRTILTTAKTDEQRIIAAKELQDLYRGSKGPKAPSR